jgi:hypothetical protein
VPPGAVSKPAWEIFGRPKGEHQASSGIPLETPGINHHNPLGRLTSPPKKRKINKELKTNTQQRDIVGKSTPEKGEGAKS